jgi:hypothetical protein
MISGLKFFRSRYSPAMKSDCLATFCLLSLTFSLAGCASKPSSTAAADPSKERKGHWEMRDPETGSHMMRRVWVDDNGRTTNSPSMGNVQTGSAASIGIQNSRSRPPGQ